ncbi:hypothetical protein T265_07643 [Opisthorchis viverrini]|uniref:Uncharacterized protein n=1 Tax=Opisthorchis viverrini TaxID=6198 RepID=A0A075AAZ9_OPIVI|nr:hypothetical protein T265_07643 [Opisthorchis viverrini]KER24754.1 hypothetical protein T265_07643 [Opisthorchis viverrini]
MPGWRNRKKWRLIDVSGVLAVSFFPNCVIERLEVSNSLFLRSTNILWYGSMSTLFRARLSSLRHERHGVSRFALALSGNALFLRYRSQAKQW